MIRRPYLALLAPVPAAGQTTLHEFSGGSEAYLSSVTGGHDLDFDGVADIVTGARFDNTAGADLEPDHVDVRRARVLRGFLSRKGSRKPGDPAVRAFRRRPDTAAPSPLVSGW